MEKTVFSYIKRFAWCLLGIGAVWSMPLESSAKLKVQKGVASSTSTGFTPYSLLNRKSNLWLNCDGYKTWITVDENGATQVYVNDDGGDFSKDEAYRVELPAGIEWRSVSIYGGKQGDNVSVDNVNIRMDGGDVQQIYLGGNGSYNYVEHDVNLTITGGTVANLGLATQLVPTETSAITYGVRRDSKIKIALSNMGYSGFRSIYDSFNGSWAQMQIFIDTNCEFYATIAQLTTAKGSTFKGAIFPDPENPLVVHAYGEAWVPDNTILTCETFKDHARTITVGTNSKIQVTKCDGWISDSNRKLSTSGPIQVKSHQRITTKIREASCLAGERNRIHCDLCMQILGYSYSFPLGHDTIVDVAVAKTCYTPGLTKGSHCSRCGEVFVEQTVVNASHSVKTLDQSYVVNVNFDAGTYTMGTSTKPRPIKENPALLRLSLCYKGQVKFYGSCEICNELISNSTPEHDLKPILAPKKNALTIQSCTRAYIAEATCTKCKLEIPIVYEPLNHASRKEVTGYAATCTEAGCKTYWECNYCSQKFRTNSTDASQKFSDMSVVTIEPTGHRYGVTDAKKIRNSTTRVSYATCSSPAIYRQVCPDCKLMSNSLIYYYGKALSHNLRIVEHHKSNLAPEQGLVTLGCTTCKKNWPSLYYASELKVGDWNYDENGIYQTDNGYWTQCVLTDITQMPTCQPGWGKYQLKVNFRGVLLKTEYENFVYPNHYAHDYDDDGVCRHRHYKMQTMLDENDNEIIRKNSTGDVVYLTDANGDSIIDETVYSAAAYLWRQVPNPYPIFEDMESTDDNVIEVFRPDYEIQTIGSLSNLCMACRTQTSPFHAHIYKDLVVNAATVTTSTNYRSALDAAYLVDYDLHGHSYYSYLNDGSAYTVATQRLLPPLEYRRRFTYRGEWESLYLPLSLSVADCENVDIADIYSFGPMCDTNGDGRLDSNDETWLIVEKLETGVTEKNYPYLIRAKQAGTLVLHSSDDIVMPETVNTVSCSSTRTQYSFVGNNRAKSLTVSPSTFVVSRGALAPVSATQSLSPQRWYMEAASVTGGYNKELNSIQASGIRVLVIGEELEQETALQLLQGESVEVELQGQRFTLDGRQAAATHSGLQVLNGRKILVK